MTLGEVIDRVRAEARRGNSLDDVIPAKVAEAVAWLERNHTFPYMRRRSSGTVVPANPTPLSSLGPSGRVKSIIGLWWTDAGRVRVFQATVRDWDELGKHRPRRFWVAEGQCWWDAEYDQSLPFECDWVQFVGAPSSFSQSFWLSENAPDLVVYKAMELLAATMRDSELMGLYRTLAAEALQTLMTSVQFDEHNTPVWFR